MSNFGKITSLQQEASSIIGERKVRGKVNLNMMDNFDLEAPDSAAEKFFKNNSSEGLKKIPASKTEIKEGKIFLTNLEEFDPNLRVIAIVIDLDNPDKKISNWTTLEDTQKGISLNGISGNLSIRVVPVNSAGEIVYDVEKIIK